MVLLVIDTQNLITLPTIYQFDLFVENVTRLIKTSREHSVEVIYVRHDDGQGSELTVGKTGFEIYEKFKPKPNEQIFDKRVNSAFKDSGLLLYLKNKKEKDIIIVGLQTDYCIDATIKCGFEHGFTILVPEGTNSTFDNDFMSARQTYEYYNTFMWNGRYAKCISLEDTLNRIGGGYEG